MAAPVAKSDVHD